MTEKRFCFVCGRLASDTFGIRSRYGRQRNAHWAPDVGVYLCPEHVVSGAEIEITYRATSTGKIDVRTTLVGGAVPTSAHAVHAIGSGKTTRDDDAQEELF